MRLERPSKSEELLGWGRKSLESQILDAVAEPRDVAVAYGAGGGRGRESCLRRTLYSCIALRIIVVALLENLVAYPNTDVVPNGSLPSRR